MSTPNQGLNTQSEAEMSARHISDLDRPGFDFFEHSDTGITLFDVVHPARTNELMVSERVETQPDMLMITRGSGDRASGKFAGTPFAVQPSNAVRATFTPYGSDSHVVYNPTSQTFGLNFPNGLLANLSPDCTKFREMAPILFHPHGQLIQFAQALKAEIASPGFASSMLVEGMSRAISVALQRLDLHPINDQADHIVLPNWKLRRVIDYIQGHLEDDVRLSDLASVAGLSTFHFARVFRQATGVTPYQYVRDRRIEHSRVLLLEDNLELSQLALKCGFASQSHFTAAFTKAVGMSPGRFRRNNRQ